MTGKRWANLPRQCDSNPGWAEARLNYGVALARAGRYTEAVEEFRETLRLQPQDERAQQMLEQAARSMRTGGAGGH